MTSSLLYLGLLPLSYIILQNLKKMDPIKQLENEIIDAPNGLPDKLFYFISKLTPLVNVDLLIQNDTKQTLLAWREDPIAGNGWHIPGGIIRFKETFSERIIKVAELEIGENNIEFENKPLEINEVIRKTGNTRGHFISMLYRCKLSKNFKIDNKNLYEHDPGYLKWHSSCPKELLPLQHEIYNQYL
jgi:ADP-ribose pyrophosphatase YjhB (NUDIX family)